MSKRAAAAAAALVVLPAALSFSAFWRRRPEPPAEWTGPFTPDEYRGFLNVIALYFGVRKVPINVKGGVLTIEHPDGTRREHLQELAELCRRSERGRWPELIAQHFAPQVGAEPPMAPPAPAPASAQPAASQPGGAAGSRDDRVAFTGMVQECFRRYGFDATVEPGGVAARDAAGREYRLDVAGLEKVPCELPREQWPLFVDGRFGEPLRALRGTQALAGRRYDDVRELLAVQFFDESWLSAEAQRETVCTRDLPGLLSGLVCRLPQATFRVSPDTVRDWWQYDDEVMAVALANLRYLRPPVERLVLAPGLEGMRFEGKGPFIAAQALLLDDYPECTGPYGALVAVPRRELLLVCPLKLAPGAGRAVSGAVVGMTTRILQSEWEGHPPLSRSLYWYRDRHFGELPYEVQTKDGRPSVEFHPPEEFARALGALGAAPPAA